MNRRNLTALAGLLIASVACSPAPVDTSASTQAEWDKTAGALLQAVQTTHPSLSADISKIVDAASERGSSTFRSVAEARGLYYPAFIRQLSIAPDSDVLAERAASEARIAYLLEHDPVACAKLSYGDSVAAIDALPPEMLVEEMRLIARVLALDPVSEPLPADSQEKLAEFINNRLDAHPERFPALRMLVQKPPSPSIEDAREMCSVNLTVIKETNALLQADLVLHARALSQMMTQSR